MLDVRDAAVRAVPLVLAASLVASVLATVGMFTVAGLRGTPPGSLWAQNVADPAGHDCGAAAGLRVLDATWGTTLGAISGPGPVDGFADGGGFSPAIGRPGPVWGSLTGRPGGSATSAWYALPPPAPEATPVVLAAGNLVAGGGTALTAVYGRRADGSVTPLDRVPLADDASSPHWRTFPLRPPAGADAVRIEATDTTDALHGWLAFTAPALARTVPLSTLLPPAAPVALGWQVAFAHPYAATGRGRRGHGARHVRRHPRRRPGRPAAGRPGRHGLGPPDRGGIYAQCRGRSRCWRCPPSAGRPVRPGVRVHLPAGAATPTCCPAAGGRWPGRRRSRDTDHPARLSTQSPSRPRRASRLAETPGDSAGNGPVAPGRVRSHGSGQALPESVRAGPRGTSSAGDLRRPVVAGVLGKVAEAATLVLLATVVPRLLGPADYGRLRPSR